MNPFRTLRADEIECRVGRCTQDGVSLLLYKDARCDMVILDETVGSMNWRREHSRDNANCTVSIWDADKAQWISKEDTGTESNTEAAKGLASDSFKRACVNWGIGRELYTAPFIWIPAAQCEIVPGRNGNYKCRSKFRITLVEYDDKRCIRQLEIINEKTRAAVYAYGIQQQPTSRQQATERPAPPKSAAMYCVDCKREIKPYRNGPKVWSAEEIADCALRKYGQPLCFDCASKRKKAKAAVPNTVRVSADQAEWIQGAYEILWEDDWRDVFQKKTGCSEPAQLPASEYETEKAYLDKMLVAAQMPMTANG